MLIRGTDQTPYGHFLLRSIKNKIVGKAKDVLTASEAGLNWDEIKEALILLLLLGLWLPRNADGRMLSSYPLGKRGESSPSRGAVGDSKEESPDLGDILRVEGRLFNGTIDKRASTSYVSERVIQLVEAPHNVRTVRTQVSLAEGSRKERKSSWTNNGSHFHF